MDDDFTFEYYCMILGTYIVPYVPTGGENTNPTQYGDGQIYKAIPNVTQAAVLPLVSGFIHPHLLANLC